MSAHRTLNDLFRAFDAVGPGHLPDPGDAGTITVDMWGQICSVVTAAAETRTLARPTKAGILCAVCLDTDGGDLTLTVTGGYNAAADTSIVYADAGDAVVFYSVKVGSSYYWRVLQSIGTDVATEATTIGDAVSAEHGAGAIGTAFAPRTYRYTRDGVIITEIHIDLTGLDSSGVENDVIGLSTGGAAYLGRNVVATNGIIFKVEMTCLEVPLTGDADVILVQGSAADEEFDDTVANSAVIADGTGDWALGETIVNTSPALTDNYYYYLTQGGTDDATYTAGQFVIRFYGHAALS